METPWGRAQTAHTIAEGIVEVSTAGHGGIHVSEKRLAQMPPSFLDTFAGRGWYEEDCDWALVVLSFPEYFPKELLPEAAKAAIRWHEEKLREANMWFLIRRLAEG